MFSNIEWKILKMFFDNPNYEVYVKETSRKLKISSGSASVLLKKLASNNYLAKKEVGKEIFYSLNKDITAVKKLRVAYISKKIASFGLKEKILKIDEYATAIAVYGSYASGDYDESSDFDLLILSNKKKNEFYKIIKEFENNFSAEIALTIMKTSDWMKLAKKKDKFYETVVRNNILLHGNLVM